jgi:hypothetical protein
MNERAVRRNLRQGPQKPAPLGRNKALGTQSEAALTVMLLDTFHSGQPMSKKQFLPIVRERHRKTVK